MRFREFFRVTSSPTGVKPRPRKYATAPSPVESSLLLLKMDSTGRSRVHRQVSAPDSQSASSFSQLHILPTPLGSLKKQTEATGQRWYPYAGSSSSRAAYIVEAVAAANATATRALTRTARRRRCGRSLGRRAAGDVPATRSTRRSSEAVPAVRSARSSCVRARQSEMISRQASGRPGDRRSSSRPLA